jgi:hypothetical protein
MKKALLLALVVVFASSTLAFSQGYIGVFASQDPAGACNFVDAGGVVSLYYYQVNSIGATAVEFQSDISQTVGWTKYGDNIPWTLVIGSFDSPMTGISISYGTSGCQVGDVYLGSSFYGVTGATPACTKVTIKNNPIPSIDGETHPIVADCTADANLYIVGGFTATVNGDASCQCGVPVQDSSWGKIKSLYK